MCNRHVLLYSLKVMLFQKLRFTNVIFFKVTFLSVLVGFLAATFRLSGVVEGALHAHTAAPPPRISPSSSSSLVFRHRFLHRTVGRCSPTRVRQSAAITAWLQRCKRGFSPPFLTHPHAHPRKVLSPRMEDLRRRRAPRGSSLRSPRKSDGSFVLLLAVDRFDCFWKVLLRLGWFPLFYLHSFRRSLSCSWSHVGVLLNFCLFCYIRSSPVIEQTIQINGANLMMLPVKVANKLYKCRTELLERIYTIIINVYFS